MNQEQHYQTLKIQIEKMLGAGHEFTLKLNPMEVMILLGYLQLAMRGIIDEEHPSARPVRDLIDQMIEWADGISPEMGKVMRMGNDPHYDVTRPGAVHLENAVNVGLKDTDEDNPPMLFFGRPQDFSYPHWHYYRLQYSLGPDFTSIIHAYVDIEMETADALAFFAPMATQLPMPNPFERRRPMAPTDPLMEDDFWHPDAGPRPPFVDEVWEEWKPDEFADYNGWEVDDE